MNTKSESSNKWNYSSLGDIAHLHYGKGLPEPKREPGQIPVFGSSGVTGYHNEALVDEPGYIVGRKGSVGTVYYSSTPFYPIDTVYYCTRSDISCDFEYFKYLLDYLPLEKLNADSAVPGLNRETAYAQEILLPDDISEQQQIASILSSLDDKIELNRKMNKTLEEIGKALFKHWFVDFEFPNEEGKPYKSGGGEMVESELGMIPKGWEIKRIDDVCQVKRGASPRPIQNFMNGSVPWVKIADATRAGGQFIFNTKEFVTEEGKHKSVFLNRGSLILSNSATCGIPTFLELEGCIHDGWLYFGNYKGITKEFLFYLLERLGAHLVQIADGSVQRNLNTNIVGSQLILIPTNQILNTFTFMTSLLFTKQKVNLRGNQVLEDIRDSLLPRLMSGRLRAN